MDQIPNNIADTIIKQAEKEAEERVADYLAHDGTDVSVLVARNGVTATVLQDKLDAFAATPRSRAGKVEALDLDGLAALVLRDYDAGSLIFADVSGPGVSFTAVLDYHGAISAFAKDTGARFGQRHGRESIVYSPKLSDEWIAWTSQANKPMSQADFAAWIDDHLPDIADPAHLRDASPDSTAVKFGTIYGFTAEDAYGYASPERMVKLSTGFSVKEGATIKSVVNLSSGEVQLQYETQHTDGDGRPLNVPRRFLLAIPVFKRESPYLIPVKLAYRKKPGAVEWYFEIFRPDAFRDDAIKGLCDGLREKLTPKDGAAPVVPVHLAKR